MGLNKKQVLFTKLQAQFQCWCFDQGISIIEAESFRTPEQAKLYAERGIGIVKSTHTKKLARDLFRYVNGTISWDRKHYEKMGEKWKTMHPLARWGGDFENRDCVHFSFEHNGVK